MIGAIITRLQAEVPVLEHRVEGAGSLADLMARNALPQHGVSANVIPLGLVGRQAEVSAGAYLQQFEEAVAIILTVRNHNAVGKAAMADLRGTIMAIVTGMIGWAPSDELGVFRLSRGSLVSASKGTIVYQIDFTITDQLRILS